MDPTPNSSVNHKLVRPTVEGVPPTLEGVLPILEGILSTIESCVCTATGAPPKPSQSNTNRDGWLHFTSISTPLLSWLQPDIPLTSPTTLKLLW